MDSARLRVPLAILVLATLFYFLASISIERMPFTSLPSWWIGMWASHSLGMYTWFGLLNGVGSLMAAIPVAILLSWHIERDRMRTAFIVGAITALVATGSSVARYSPFAHRATAFMTLELFLVMVLVLPLLIWLLHALPFKKRMSESRRS
jgi:hypothetical protein